MQVSAHTLRDNLQCDLREYNSRFEDLCTLPAVMPFVLATFSTLHLVHGLWLRECNDQNMCFVFEDGQEIGHWTTKARADEIWWDVLGTVNIGFSCSFLLLTTINCVSLAIFKKQKKLSQRHDHFNTICLALTYLDSEMVKKLPKELLAVIAEQI